MEKWVKKWEEKIGKRVFGNNEGGWERKGESKRWKEREREEIRNIESGLS